MSLLPSCIHLEDDLPDDLEVLLLSPTGLQLSVGEEGGSLELALLPYQRPSNGQLQLLILVVHRMYPSLGVDRRKSRPRPICFVSQSEPEVEVICIGPVPLGAASKLLNPGIVEVKGIVCLYTLEKVTLTFFRVEGRNDLH